MEIEYLNKSWTLPKYFMVDCSVKCLFYNSHFNQIKRKMISYQTLLEEILFHDTPNTASPGCNFADMKRSVITVVIIS